MATTANRSTIDSLSDHAESAARVGIRTLCTARAYSRPSAVSLDVALDAAGPDRRRRTIAELARHSHGAKLTNIAERVAAAEYGVRVSDLSSQERKRVYVSLYQTHVPKLVDLGLVEYDDDSGYLATTPALRDVAQWLEDGSLRFDGGDA